MKHLYEQDMVGDQQYAKDLLAAQAWYNTEIKRLNDMLAKKKSDAMVAFQTRVLAKTAQERAAVSQQTQKTAPTTQQAAATGTVTTAGQPVSASGSPAPAKVESYSDPDILRINDISEEFVDKYAHIPIHQRNWYQKPEAQPGYNKWKEEQEKLSKTSRKKRMTSKVQNQIYDIEGEIDDLKNEIKFIRQKFESPSYEGAEGEAENFMSEIGFDAIEILGSGAYKNDEEKAYALQAAGIENPEQIIQDYYYYYPEFNPALEKERKEADKKIEKLESKIEQLETKLSKMEEMYESINETEFSTVNADQYELQTLKDYMDAENISYSEDVSGDSIDFDETELNKEMQDSVDDMSLEEIVSDDANTDDILTIDDEEPSESEEDFADEDEKIDENKVFYVKVDNEGEEFVGKIYKLFDDGDWRSKVVDGESETFEQLNYDPDYDEFDIISFLRENYADAELLSEDEYNKYIESSDANPKEEEVKESLHVIPTLDEFIGKHNK